LRRKNGRFFRGQVSFRLNGTEMTKDFAGVLSQDGKTPETVEYPDGFCDSVMISADEIELIFRTTIEPSRIAIDILKRSK
jgi:hypothetical protein